MTPLTNKQSKLTRTALYLRTYESMFQCPICHASMKVHNLKSLTCSNNHTFDLAKQGYLNLLTKQIPTHYTKALFASRRHVITESDFFTSLHEKMIDVIHEQTEAKKHVRLIDMGSGEGSHLHRISHDLQTQWNTTVTGVGIDIAKEGILEAAKTYGKHLWFVADIASPPFADKTFDVIINILSPSNYDAFRRILTDDGIIVKVVPGENYLKEIRDFFYKQAERQDYSNEKIIHLFKDNFQLVKRSKVYRSQFLDKLAIQSLLQMTPLTWHISDEKRQSFLEANITHITVDLEILVGRKKDPS